MARGVTYPVLLWQDHQNSWTARVVEGDAPAGFGGSPQRALEQLQEYLTWLHREDPWTQPPDFLEAELLVYKVYIRPEYKHEGRRYPCDESFPLRVHVVRGKQEHGLLICSLPTLDLRFYYYEAGALKNLVSHYVQQHLEGYTPRELAGVLPPIEARLEHLTLNVKVRSSRGDGRRSASVLAGVAEALGEPTFRRQFSKPYRRDVQVNTLVKRLRDDRVSVLVVGDPGCGKTTVLVEAVAQVERSGEEGQSRRRFWQTSGGRLISGMQYLGQWEERCEEIINEIRDQDGYLCADNLLDLIRLGGESPTNSLGAFFLPYLQRGELRMVAEASPAEVDACRRLLPGLVDVFEVLPIPEMTREEAIAVLENLASALIVNYHIELAVGVIARIYSLFRRFSPYGAFPGKASAFLKEVFDRAKQQRFTKVEANLVVQLFMRQTGLPELFLRDELTLDGEQVLGQFRSKIIDQEEACRAATRLVTIYKAGLNDPNRPIGVLLFCGPTGVGKTEMARAISRFFFGHGEEGDRMIRLDMSEYTGWRAGDKILLGPDNEPSELIRKVRQQPFALVLFDEIEKADPEVFDVLMGVFDEGRLTDRYGRLTSFRSTILILTSNLGAGKGQSFGFNQGTGTDYTSEAMGFFRPEFFNRLDGVVTFQPLNASSIRVITRKELIAIGQREGLRRLGVQLTWSDEVEAFLARTGYDERYGARPLQRALETLVVTPLSHYILSKSPRNVTIRLELDGEQVVIT